MRFRFWLFLLMLAVGAASAEAQTPAPASGQPAAASGPVFVVTYFEVAPAASSQVASQLRQFAAASRKENGNAEFTLLREIGRGGRYAIVEAWQDKAALDAHAAAMKALGDKLQPVFVAPFDPRQFGGLSVMPTTSDLSHATLALTHVDVVPSGKEQVAAMVKRLAEDSRKEAGALRFDALIQDGRPNHFHLIEAWATRSARDVHALAQHTRDFRAKLVPFEGALYDERLFEMVR